MEESSNCPSPLNTANRPKSYRAYLRDPSIPIPRRTVYRHKRRNKRSRSREYSSEEENICVSNDSPAPIEHTEQDHHISTEGVQPEGEQITQDELTMVSDSEDYTCPYLSDESEYHSGDEVHANLSDCSQDDFYKSPNDNLPPGDFGWDIANNEDQPLYDGASITQQESVLLILTLAVTHRLSAQCIDDLISVVNLHCIPGQQNKCMKSLSALKKYFSSQEIPVERHHYCSHCSEYLGDTASLPESCGVCNKQLNSPKSTGSFVLLPIDQQIKELFNRKDFRKALQYRYKRIKTCQSNIEDVYDGQLYKNLCLPGGPLAQDPALSLKFNTDGVAIFKSSNSSIWPLFFQVNELPPLKRKSIENMVLGGLWFGDKKPIMSTFLKPFGDSLLTLESEGVSVFNGSACDRIKVVLLSAVLDLPARASFMEMMQYNGFNSCCYCHIKGVSCKSSTDEESKGRVTVFPYNVQYPTGFPEKRTKYSLITDGMQALQRGGNAVNGVRGICPFVALQHFDPVQGVCLDYMHGVLLGVTRQLMSLWFDTKYKDEPWYCGRHLNIVDERLCSIKPPLNVTRTPRSIESHRKYFKASEFRNWLFFYGVPCLIDVLPDIYLHHFMLLVYSVWLLNQNTISPDEIEQSAVLLCKFVLLFDGLYGERHMTINVHNLLHLTSSVVNNGPLWGTSAFEFEGANRDLTALYHGTQQVDMQIASAMSILKYLPELAKTLMPDSPAERLYRKMKYRSPKCSLEHCQEVQLLGSLSVTTLTPDIEEKIRNLAHVPIIGECETFKRVQVNGEVFHCKEYARVTKRNSYTVKYHVDNAGVTEEAYGQVQYFLKLSSRCTDDAVPKYFAVISPLTPMPCQKIHDASIRGFGKQLQAMCSPRPDSEVVIVFLEQILRKCLYMEFRRSDHAYVANFPNFIETD